MTLTLTLLTALLGNTTPASAPLDLNALEATPAVAFAQVDPVAATLDNVSVRLRCTALASGQVADCVVLEETRPGYGFGEAALALMSQSQVAPVIERGRPVDAVFERTIDFTR